jgi:putative (di)nucleoside polyphosphate hydrolase
VYAQALKELEPLLTKNRRTPYGIKRKKR